MAHVFNSHICLEALQETSDEDYRRRRKRCFYSCVKIKIFVAGSTDLSIQEQLLFVSNAIVCERLSLLIYGFRLNIVADDKITP